MVDGLQRRQLGRRWGRMGQGGRVNENNRIMNYEEQPPRDTNWNKDGIGIDANGMVVIRAAGEPLTCFVATTAKIGGLLRDEWQMKQELEDANRFRNACQPDRFIPKVIQDLEKKANEAAAMRGDGLAGKVMWGQEQAYRDAIAALKSYLPRH